MKTCSNEGNEVSTGHFLLPGEASTVRIWLHSVKLLARGGSDENSQTTSAVVKTSVALSTMTVKPHT